MGRVKHKLPISVSVLLISILAAILLYWAFMNVNLFQSAKKLVYTPEELNTLLKSACPIEIGGERLLSCENVFRKILEEEQNVKSIIKSGLVEFNGPTYYFEVNLGDLARCYLIDARNGNIKNILDKCPID